MSINLLKYLNGNNNGYFKRYIDRLKNDPLIAWYPSAGNDFHPLLYLSPAYSKYNPSKENVEESFPDIFLFTDYYPWENFSSSTTIYQDKRTNITVNNIEELLSLNLPLDSKIVLFRDSPKFFGYSPEYSSANGKVIYLEVKENQVY